MTTIKAGDEVRVPCEHQDDWAIDAILFGGVEAKADVVCMHTGCGWQGRVALFPEPAVTPAGQEG